MGKYTPRLGRVKPYTVKCDMCKKEFTTFNKRHFRCSDKCRAKRSAQRLTLHRQEWAELI